MATRFALSLLVLLGCGNPSAPAPWVEGELATLHLQGDEVEVRLAPVSTVPKLGQMFDVEGHIERSQSRRIQFVKVDARMPAHGHGMVTTAKTVLHSGTQFSTKGMKLHMFGDWVIVVLVRFADGTSRELRHPVRYLPRAHGQFDQ